jgi:tetratricopeptide (TPR) repeat protein
VIGPYKLIEPIGEGGMGTVWMAQQTAPVRRLVAVKLIKAGMDTKQVVARFEAERQALALMDHPHIARVLDAGATPAGRPYFAMELVKGIPITRYCDERRLSVRERLELFVPVCQAVQHAHQKGVIHRDLKPSNVLVATYDGVPVVKVIDFGVAKAAGQPLTERTLATGFGALVGTLEYMSPEQAELNNVDIDTRSDIYSLGVLLYELLTGTTPLPKKRLSEAALTEVLRIIREEEPPRPSTRLSTTEELPAIAANRKTEPSQLRGLVRGELDWIVMKALEKDRTRRYETANGFAADVQRHLADEPVLACPPSAAYRFRKFARRNKRALATTMLVAATLVAGTAVSTWQAIRATTAEGLARTRLVEVTQERSRADSARQEADRRATEAREVVDFLINDLIGAAAPSRAQGTMPTVDQVLARADEGIAKKFADRPLIEASIRHALGQAYEELGHYLKAEQHAARAVELRLAHLGPEHAETIAAQNALGFALILRNEGEKTQPLMTPVLATARKALGPEHPETLESMQVLALALGNPDEGRALNEELLAIRKRVPGPVHPDTLATMNNLAFRLQVIGDFETAKQLYEQILVAFRDQPNHPNTFIQMSNMADLYDRLRQHDRAIDLMRRIVEGRVRVLGLAHPFTQQSIGSYLGSARRDRASWEEARRTLEPILDRSRRELDRLRRELGPEAERTIALTGGLANALSLLGQTEKAVALVDGLPENREALNVREAWARSLYVDDHRDAALIQFQRVEALRPRLVPADDSFGLKIRTRLALVLREHGRFAEARPLLEQTVAEAARLRTKAPKRDTAIEWPGATAEFLLRQWPGLAPGLSPAQRPPASLAIEAPFRAQSPLADGRIDAEEYGPGISVRFDDDSNPGGLLDSKSRSKTPDDLSYQFHAAYTDRSLFLAFRVRDQFVDLSKSKAWWNDGAILFINGDQVANDQIYLLNPNGGNREGFWLGATVGGHRVSVPYDLRYADWKVGTTRTADGYIMELEIPLALIDTRDGPEFVPATSGSEIRFNFEIMDSDTSHAEFGQMDFGIFWVEHPQIAPTEGGEDFWTVSLRLVPKPSSSPRPAAGR